MNYAIILSGGSGSRFWPLSRKDQPKQFLSIYSNRPMIQETIQRITGPFPKRNIYIAANMIHKKQTKTCLKGSGLESKNLFFEPEARNTFAPIGLLTQRIYDKDENAVISVFPCDHYIKDKKRFSLTLKKAIEVAKKGYIVTLGIKPDRPETGYGYIKVKSKLKSIKEEAYMVERLKEKPQFSKAKKFFADKKYYWNAGIFIFRAKDMLDEIKKIMPGDFSLLTKINSNNLKRHWQRLSPLSIDYAIMEKTNRMALIPGDFGWLDIGSWNSVAGLFKKNKEGNILRGNCIDIGSKDIFSFSEGKLVASVGLRDTIIVVTDAGVLVCSKDKAQEVRKIAGLLRKNGAHPG